MKPLSLEIVFPTVTDCSLSFKCFTSVNNVVNTTVGFFQIQFYMVDQVLVITQTPVEVLEF